MTGHITVLLRQMSSYFSTVKISEQENKNRIDSLTMAGLNYKHVPTLLFIDLKLVAWMQLSCSEAKSGVVRSFLPDYISFHPGYLSKGNIESMLVPRL